MNPIARQAIVTQVLPTTNTKPVRIRAYSARGKAVVGTLASGNASSTDMHIVMADALAARYVREDHENYGTPPEKNPWAGKRVVGVLPNGDHVHVFI